MMISSFSLTYLPFVCLLQSNVCSPQFDMYFEFLFISMSYLYILAITPLSNMLNANIFSPLAQFLLFLARVALILCIPILRLLLFSLAVKSYYFKYFLVFWSILCL